MNMNREKPDELVDKIFPKRDPEPIKFEQPCQHMRAHPNPVFVSHCEFVFTLMVVPPSAKPIVPDV